MADSLPDAPAPPFIPPDTPDDPAFAAEHRLQAAFIAGGEDVEGLIAYALHRRASLEFAGEFRRRHGRRPEPGEIAAFETGEIAPSRIAAYRAEARRLVESWRAGAGQDAVREQGQQPSGSAIPRRWPWFGLLPETQPAAGPIDWKGLTLRLLVLLLAVIVTALLLRVLVVQP
ncbi:MAG: hypothetical protein LDL25_07560 [Hyphomicrobiales bacterium]|nr:hypothetical protein [Hyphomicrobiales bacterium]